MKFRTLLLFFYAPAALLHGAEPISTAETSNAQVVALNENESGRGPYGVVQVILEGKAVWQTDIGWAPPEAKNVAWSPSAQKVALIVRGTKRTSTLHVVDLSEERRELNLPDLEAATNALNGHHEGRVFQMQPLSWTDDDHLLIRVSGNLVDWGTDGYDHLNFDYIYLLQLSTMRVLSVTCTSAHDLTSKELQAEP